MFDELGVGDNMACFTAVGGNTTVSALGGEEADIEVSFPTNPPAAFGMGVFSNNQQNSSERIIYYGLTDNVLLDMEMPLTPEFDDIFVGYIADEPIARVVLDDADDGDYMGIGDVVFAVTTVATRSSSWGSVKGIYR